MGEVYALKVRIKFAKKGALVYIGHLDVMRYFQKLFRRAMIPIKYSEGFSPHQILSFSHPLPLGMESEGEYADIELTQGISSSEALERIRKESVPEIEIYSFKELPDRCENAMASVKAASYYVKLLNRGQFENLSRAVDLLLAKDEVIVTKVTKKGEKLENIRSFILEVHVEDNDSLSMMVSSGSMNNLKPETVVAAIGECVGVTIDKTDLYMRRIDQFTLVDDKLISLDDIGKTING